MFSLRGQESSRVVGRKLRRKVGVLKDPCDFIKTRSDSLITKIVTVTPIGTPTSFGEFGGWIELEEVSLPVLWPILATLKTEFDTLVAWSRHPQSKSECSGVVNRWQLDRLGQIHLHLDFETWSACGLGEKKHLAPDEIRMLEIRPQEHKRAPSWFQMSLMDFATRPSNPLMFDAGVEDIRRVPFNQRAMNQLNEARFVRDSTVIISLANPDTNALDRILQKIIDVGPSLCVKATRQRPTHVKRQWRPGVCNSSIIFPVGEDQFDPAHHMTPTLNIEALQDDESWDAIERFVGLLACGAPCDPLHSDACIPTAEIDGYDINVISGENVGSFDIPKVSQKWCATYVKMLGESCNSHSHDYHVVVVEGEQIARMSEITEGCRV